MSTASDLVEETLSYLYAGTRESVLRLSGTHDDTTTTLTFQDRVNFDPGTVLSVDLEQILVWAVTENTATVQRGYQNSNPASHANSSVLTVNAKFPKFGVLRAINAELSALSSPANGLFQMRTLEFTYNSAIDGYDLEDTVTDTAIVDPDSIYSVTYDESGPEKRWPEVKTWRLIRNANPSDFPSGYAIVLIGPESGRKVRVTYKSSYGSLANLSDDIQTTTGLSSHADDIPPLGAAFRLASVREVARNFFEHQSETRRADEVPSGSQLRGSAGLIQLRETRIKEERARLARQYPHRRKQY